MNQPSSQQGPRGRAEKVRRNGERRRAGHTPAIRLLLVDDHPLVREGLKRTLASMVGLVVIGEAATGEEAVERAKDLEPNLVIMDLTLPRMSGIEATRLIKAHAPATRVLALTMHAEQVYVRRAIEAGVSGYVLKDARPSDLLEAIQAIHRGEEYMMVGGTRTPLRRS